MPTWLENLITVLRWQDTLDILIISYILFRLYILLRGTRLLRVTLIISLLFLVQRVFTFSGLVITRAVIQSITALTAIGVLIVFRNEIRGLFQSKSLRDLFWSIGIRPLKTPLKMICEAVFRLAHRRVGALLVFPLHQPVDGLIQSGIAWHGKVSREMIESIFWPDNPVHDGAVVIKGEEVVQVAGLLPLTDRENLPSYYGTRHRAALGLAEQSDARVVVVSEERGQVAVAVKGKLHTVHTASELEQMLQDTPGNADITDVQLLRKDRWSAVLAALLSLVVVSGIWSSLSMGVVRTLTTVEAPVEYVQHNPDMEIIETSSTSVKIQLSGSPALINTLEPDQVKVRFDLTRATPGKNVLTITEENMSLPPGAAVKKIDPPAVEVTLDVLERKKLPVQVDWTGRLPPNILIPNVSIFPSKIEVVGGRLVLNQLDTIYTQPVPVDNLTRSGTLNAPLRLIPSTIKPAPGQENTIFVQYTVVQRQEKADTEK